MHLCVSTIINTLPGTEGERLWVASHYDAVETVKFMTSIELKSDLVIKLSAIRQTPGWAP